MALRSTARATRIPSEALIWFPVEKQSSVIQVKHLVCSQTAIAVGNVVGVDWDGVRCPAKTVALGGKFALC